MEIIKRYGIDDAGFYKDKLLDWAFFKCATKDIIGVLNFLEGVHIDGAEKNFLETMGRLKKRENRWDIKIVDWIMENYRRIPIASDIGHPSGEVMWYTGQLILRYLGFETSEERFSEYVSEYRLGLGGIVEPCVQEALGLEYGIDWITCRANVDYVHEFLTGEIRPNRDFDKVRFLQDYYLVRYGKLLPYRCRSESDMTSIS